MKDVEILVAEGLDVVHQGVSLLSKVNLTLKAHSTCTLIGPNGAGKSTLLRVLLGILTPTSGFVKKAPWIRLGYVPQRFNLDATLPLTVGYFLSLSSARASKLDQQILTETAVDHLLKSSLTQLSGGELQRVLLTRALLQQPDLLLLDEPMQGVDVKGQVDLYRLIRGVQQKTGCAVLMVSHDLNFVLANSDEVICLNRKVCCKGTPKALSNHPEFLNLMGAQLAEQMAFYRHAHDA